MAGIYVLGGTTHLDNVSIIDNVAIQYGAIRIFDSNVFISGSEISGTTTDLWGTIVARGSSSYRLVVWNSIISRNRVSTGGQGALSVNGPRLLSINNVFSGNESHGFGSAIDVFESTAQIINNVFFNNSATGQRSEVTNPGR